MRRVSAAASDVILRATTHQESHPHPKRTARRKGHHITTEYRHRREGSPDLLRLERYIAEAEEPFRALAHLRAVAYREAIQRMDREQAIQRYREVHIALVQRRAEAELNRLMPDVSRSDRRLTHQRLAALHEELSELERRLEQLDVSMAESDPEAWR